MSTERSPSPSTAVHKIVNSDAAANRAAAKEKVIPPLPAEIARQWPRRPAPGQTTFRSTTAVNIPCWMDEWQIEQTMEQFGEVMDVRLVRHSQAAPRFRNQSTGCAYIDFVLASTAKQVADLRQIRVGGRTVSVRPFGANTVNTHFPRFEYPTTVTSLNKIIQEQNDTRIDRGRVASSAVHRTPTHMGVGRQQMPPQQGGNQGGNNRNQGGNGNRMNQTQRPAYATPRANGGRNGDNVAKKTRTVTSSVVATVTNPAACSTTGAPAQATEAPKGGDQKQGGVETAIPDASKINSQNEVGAPTTTGEAAVDSPKSDVTAEVKEVAA